MDRNAHSSIIQRRTAFHCLSHQQTVRNRRTIFRLSNQGIYFECVLAAFRTRRLHLFVTLWAAGSRSAGLTLNFWRDVNVHAAGIKPRAAEMQRVVQMLVQLHSVQEIGLVFWGPSFLKRPKASSSQSSSSFFLAHLRTGDLVPPIAR